MKINEIDTFSVKGHPILTLRDKDGTILWQYDHDNVVVKLGKAAIIQLLAGDFSGVKITTCKLGTGGVNVNDPFTPIAPTASDAALVAVVSASSKAVDGFTYDNADKTSITFAALFLAENVNTIVSEAGLFTSNGNLFARYTFPSAYLKADRGYSLEVAWTIKLL